MTVKAHRHTWVHTQIGMACENCNAFISHAAIQANLPAKGDSDPFDTIWHKING